MGKDSDPFVMCPVSLLRDHGLNDQEFRLMLALLSHCRNGALTCFPSVSRLAGMLGKNARRITDTLSRLESKGYLKRNFNRGKATTYQLAPQTDPRQICQGLPDDTPDESVRGGVTKTSGDPCQIRQVEIDVQVPAPPPEVLPVNRF